MIGKHYKTSFHIKITFKMSQGVKFTTDDFMLPYKCFFYVFNDLGFDRNDTRHDLPGLVNKSLASSSSSNKYSNTATTDDLNYFGITMIVLASFGLILSSMNCYGVCHLNQRLSIVQKLFIYSSATDIALAINVLLNGFVTIDVCTRNAIIVMAGVYSMLTRIQSLFMVCLLRMLAITSTTLEIKRIQKIIFVFFQLTVSLGLALYSGYANSAHSSLNLLTLQFFLISFTVFIIIFASIIVNTISSLTLRRQRRVSFKVFTVASSRGDHHQVAIKNLFVISFFNGLCYLTPSAYYLFFGTSILVAKQQDLVVIKILGQIHWFKIPVLLTPSLTSFVYMIFHKDIYNLYKTWFCKCCGR